MKLFLALLLSSFCFLSLKAAGNNLEAFEQSKLIWDNLNPCSYQYSVYYRSDFGRYAERTDIKVDDDKVVKREYNIWSWMEGETKLFESWIEENQDVGTHQGGFPPKILDDLYHQCKQEYLIQTGENVRIFFETDGQGLLRRCGYDYDNCSDECFSGFFIENITIG